MQQEKLTSKVTIPAQPDVVFGVLAGEVEFGGWMWRYDIEAAGPAQSLVTLTYDWSEATPEARAVIQFPPFGVDDLEHSLRHLSDLASTLPSVERHG